MDNAVSLDDAHLDFSQERLVTAQPSSGDGVLKCFEQQGPVPLFLCRVYIYFDSHTITAKIINPYSDIELYLHPTRMSISACTHIGGPRVVVSSSIRYCGHIILYCALLMID